jgi:hypothetical protein
MMVRLSILGVLAILLAASGAAEARTITFSGYEWTVRGAGRGGPGPNEWDDANVRVDARGDLHLKVAPRDGVWRCAEVSTTPRFGFGCFQFWIVGRVDKLDPNLVLGLFTYPSEEVGPDGTNEIDIEFANWGRAAWPNGNYTVYPAQLGLRSASQTFRLALSGGTSTQRFTWTPTSLFFQTLQGHRDDDAQQLASWRYAPSDPSQHISQQPMPVSINLWLFNGKPPADGKPVEVVVRAFKYTAG